MATPTIITDTALDWAVAAPATAPAPEPLAWLDDTDLREDLDAIERDDIEAMLMDWWYEEQMHAIEDDHETIIATMGGY